MAKSKPQAGAIIAYKVEQPVKQKDLHEKQQRCCEVMAQILKIEASKAKFSNVANLELKPLREERDKLLLATEQGIEEIMVDARPYYDYETFTVKVIQEGTRRVLEERAMTEEEKNRPELPAMEPAAADIAEEEAAAVANAAAREAKKAAKKAAGKNGETKKVKVSGEAGPRKRRSSAQAEA